MRNKIKIILFGAGGHAVSAIDVIEKTKKFKILFVLDKFDGRIGKYKVFRQKKQLKFYKKFTNKAFITIGQIKNANIRRKLHENLLKEKFILPSIVSPLAYVADSTKIGAGTIVMHHAILNAKSEVGQNCIINTKALIEHGVKIENNCHLSTGCIVNGDSHVKNGTFLGSGSIIIQGLKIGKNAIIGAGKIIKKNLSNKKVFNK